MDLMIAAKQSRQNSSPVKLAKNKKLTVFIFNEKQ